MAAATKRPRYCKRHRKIALIDHHDAEGRAVLTEPVSALITRYRFGAKRRKPHYVYWYRGTWYRARNAVTDLGPDGRPCAWEWALVPISRETAWDAYLIQTIEDGKAAPVVLTITGGRASARGAKGTAWEGAPLLDGTEPADYVADLLDLDRPEPAPYRGKHFAA